MGLKARFNTRLKALYRMHGAADRRLARDAFTIKGRQNLIDEKTAIGLCIRIFREDPQYVMAKILAEPAEDFPEKLGERIRRAAEAVEGA